MTTAEGQKVTIKETSSTTYENGTNPAAVSMVTTGQPVLVLRTADNVFVNGDFQVTGAND